MPTKRPLAPPAGAQTAPCGDASHADLLRHLTLARAQNAYLHRELATALKHAPMAPLAARTEDQLRLEIDHLRQAYATLKLHYADAEQKLAQLQYSLGLAYRALGWHQDARDLLGPETQLVETLLTHLLTLAHPDRWSQGQPAVELAHELAVAINAQRARLAHP